MFCMWGKDTCARWETIPGCSLQRQAPLVVQRQRICLPVWRRRSRGFDPWVWKIPGMEEELTPVFLPGTFHGQRSLSGYSPWGCREHTHITHHSIQR